MRNYILCSLLLLLFPSGVFSHTLNVLILQRAPATTLAFEQDYTLLVGGKVENSFSKNDKLLAEPIGNKIRLTVLRAKKGRKPLGTFAAKIDIVRTQAANKKQPNDALLAQEAKQNKAPFVTLRQAAYGGPITYTGPLTLFAKSGLNIVETVELEQYVTQVVNCELGGEKSLNALKAQSVLVRTYALFVAKTRLQALEQGKKEWLYFQVFSTPRDQAYNCKKRANDRELPPALVKQAVKETAGEVLLKKGKLVRVQYNTCRSKQLPQGVICQERMIRLARQGKPYAEVLRSFIPSAQIKKYDLSQFYSQTVKKILRQALENK